MAEPKTRMNDESVEDFLNEVSDEQKRKDSFAILKLMNQVTKCEPRMWGTSVVGFGAYRCTYADGSQADWPMIGFSPRKQSLVLYISPSLLKHDDLMKNLGKRSIGKSCLYINRLSDIDLPTLKKLVEVSFKRMKKKYS